MLKVFCPDKVFFLKLKDFEPGKATQHNNGHELVASRTKQNIRNQFGTDNDDHKAECAFGENDNTTMCLTHTSSEWHQSMWFPHAKVHSSVPGQNRCKSAHKNLKGKDNLGISIWIDLWDK